MFTQGDVFENPVTGERATIRLGTRETMGERLIIDLELRGKGFGSPLHFHPGIHEQITVVSGYVRVCIDGVTSIAKLDKRFDIAPGVPHRFWNAGVYDAQLTIEIRPASRLEAYKFEAFTRNMIGLAQDGKTNAKGMPNLLQFAPIAREFEDVIRFVSPSPWIQSLLFPMLAPIARLCGYHRSYNEYIFRAPAKRAAENRKLPLFGRL